MPDTIINFENFEKRIKKINKCAQNYGMRDLYEAQRVCEKLKIDVPKIVKDIQQIAFNDAVWAYTLGCAIAAKSKITSAIQAAEAIGRGLEAFCIEGSVAEERHVGVGHGNLASMLLNESTKCFAFLAGHESFAAAEGAIGIAKTADRVRKRPLKVILNGLGKDAAYIISRINGFTYVKTEYDFGKNILSIISEKSFSSSESTKIKCYGANEALEGVAIFKHENVDISITGNSTNPVRFQHLVAGTYKKWCTEHSRKYFSVASGGGIGRTLHPDNVAAGPASYGLTDSMGRMHGDSQFAGSSSVPAHVEMMGFVGMGNNPMVGATVSCAVMVAEAMKSF